MASLSDALRARSGGDGGVGDFCFDDGMCVPISRRDQIQGELARLGVVEFLVPMTPGGLATEVVATVAGMPILRMGGRLVVRVLDRFRPATTDELTGGGARVHGTDALEGGGAPNTAGRIPSTTAQTQNLRGNMQREGMRFDPGEEAHHIVARNDMRAAEARDLLAEAGVDVNSPANGVPLPGTRTTPNPSNKAVHRGDVIHSQGYYDYVNSELRNVPAPQRPGVIRRIADELERGEINW